MALSDESQARRASCVKLAVKTIRRRPASSQPTPKDLAERRHPRVAGSCLRGGAGSANSDEYRKALA